MTTLEEIFLKLGEEEEEEDGGEEHKKRRKKDEKNRTEGYDLFSLTKTTDTFSSVVFPRENREGE